MTIVRLIAVLLAPTLGLFGCASKAPPSPVTERSADVRVIEGGFGRSAATPAPAAVAGDTGPSHIIKKGETLYGIALDQGLDYKDLARWNGLENPNRILVGQRLRLSDPATVVAASVVDTAPAAEGVEVRPIVAPAAIQSASSPATVGTVGVPQTVAGAVGGTSGNVPFKVAPKGGKQPYSVEAMATLKGEKTAFAAAPAAVAVPSPAATPPVTAPAVVSVPVVAAVPNPAPAAPTAQTWIWPLSGKVIANFNEGGNKGVDLGGKVGDPVLAAAGGKVSYVGSSLRGYGKMVVIKHSAEFLSVYAHNSKILVTEGQNVTSGMKIAEVGDSDADSPRLHFEIRRQGKPVDPASFLPPR